jgi:hypothetical protein
MGISSRLRSNSIDIYIGNGFWKVVSACRVESEREVVVGVSGGLGVWFVLGVVGWIGEGAGARGRKTL